MPKRKIKYRAKYSGRVYDTAREAAQDNAWYLNDVSYRYDAKRRNLKKPKEYAIPFINDKRITLSNAGLATGAVLSENVLDTIAKYADAAGLPVKTALGLAVKESTLGNPTDDTSVYKLLNPRQKAWFKSQGTGQHINEGYNLDPRELVNFYVDINTPYDDAKGHAARKSMKGDVLNEDKFHKILIEGEAYADKQAKTYEQQYGNNNVLYNAFNFYKNNPNSYNPNQSNYQQLVNKRANEVWGSPEIQSWWKRRSLEEGGNR